MKYFPLYAALLTAAAFIDAAPVSSVCSNGSFNTSGIRNGGPYQSPVNGVKITNGLIRIGYRGASNLFSSDATMSPNKPLIIEFTAPVKEMNISYNTCGVRGKGGVIEVFDGSNQRISRKVTDGKYCGRINLPLFHDPFTTTVKGKNLRKIVVYFDLNDTPCNTVGNCNYGIGIRELSWKC
ncbi:hypothetical protein K7432_004094 [Basidiobolus ranarum]|uniref:Uncharacterized protein n=1 Tax=Basidiobolus ranarum TaxID=34480 RepID=A0ABR2WYV3_9FUNG